MSTLTATADQTNAAVSVVVLWAESMTVTGTVADGADTKYAVGDEFPANVGATGYTLTLPDGFNRLVATLTGAAGNPAGTDIDLYLTRAREVVAAATTAAVDDEQIILGDMPAGTYELWAYGHTVVPLLVGYSITVTGSVPLHVERVYPDGTSAEVLGSPVVPGDDGYAVLWDTVAPLDGAVYYRAIDPLTNVVLTSNTVTITGQGDGWLKDPSMPSLDVHLADCALTCPTPTPNLGGGITQTVLDTFSRSTSSGWGTADTGQAWTISTGTAANFSTTGTTGQVAVSAVNSDRIITLATSATDVDLTVDVRVPLATGAAINTYAIARWTDASNHYRFLLVFNTGATIAVGLEKVVAAASTTIIAQTPLTGVTHIAAVTYRLRCQVDGTTFRVKAWPLGSDEPADWAASVVDASLTGPGAVGARTFLSSGNTNTLPVAVVFDNLTAATATIPSSVGPAVDRSAIFTALEAESRATASGTFPIIDAARSRAVAQTRKAPGSVLRLLTQQLDQAQAMVNLLASGRTLLLQLDADYGWAYDAWASDYIDVGDATEERITVNKMTKPQRQWKLPFDLGRPPSVTSGHVHGSTLAPAGNTYGDETASGLTYQDEITTGGTYLQASLGTVA